MIRPPDLQHQPDQYNNAKQAQNASENTVHISETEPGCFFLNNIGYSRQASPPEIGSKKYPDD